MKWLLGRLSEPTSIAGLAALVSSVLGALQGTVSANTAATVAAGAVIGILLPEKPKAQ
jgi:hypothetical protein